MANLARTERIAVFIDEFTYILEVSPDITGTLQNLWDQELGKTNLLLCISGSHLGMMSGYFFWAFHAAAGRRAHEHIKMRSTGGQDRARIGCQQGMRLMTLDRVDDDLRDWSV